MKITTIFKAVGVVFCAAIITGFVSAQQDSMGKINFLLGKPDDVNILHCQETKWSNAKLFSQVFNGDRIKTKAESRCEIKLNDQSLIRIGEKTAFTLNKDNLNDKFNSEIKKGRLWANIRKLNKKRKFQLRTPTAVCSIRGTIYRVDADSSTKILVYEGSVDVGPPSATGTDSTAAQEKKMYQPPHEVPGPTQVPGPFEVTLDQWVQIVAGYQIEVRADGKYHKSKIDDSIDSQDDWVKWNLERDAAR